MDERDMSERGKPLVIITSLAACLATGAQPSMAAAPAYEKVAPTAQMTPSEEEAKKRLESAGYSDVTNVKSSSEGISAKAVKDGKKVNITIDTFGKIIATPAE